MKWQLVFTTLPLAILVVIAKFFFSEVTGIEGFLSFSDISLVLTGGLFLMGFMLAGTMADYKEAEKIPAEVATTLALIDESLQLVREVKKPPGFGKTQDQFMTLTSQVPGFFTNQISFQEVTKEIDQLVNSCQEASASSSSLYLYRATNELAELRKLLNRVYVIRRTDFIAYGYAFIELLLILLFFVLMITSFDTDSETIVLTSFTSLIFLYLYRLIRDIDNPFSYGKKGKAIGSVVDLFPIQEYREGLKSKYRGIRMEERVESMERRSREEENGSEDSG